MKPCKNCGNLMIEDGTLLCLACHEKNRICYECQAIAKNGSVEVNCERCENRED